MKDIKIERLLITIALAIIMVVVLIISDKAKHAVEGYYSGSDELRSTIQAMQTQIAR